MKFDPEVVGRKCNEIYLEVGELKREVAELQLKIDALNKEKWMRLVSYLITDPLPNQVWDLEIDAGEYILSLSSENIHPDVYSWLHHIGGNIKEFDGYLITRDDTVLLRFMSGREQFLKFLRKYKVTINLKTLDTEIHDFQNKVNIRKELRDVYSEFLKKE